MGKSNCLAFLFVFIFSGAILGQEQKDSLVFIDEGNKLTVLHVSKTEEFRSDSMIPTAVKIETYKNGNSIFRDTLLRLHWFLGCKIIQEIKERKTSRGYDLNGKLIEAGEPTSLKEEKIKKSFFVLIIFLLLSIVFLAYCGFNEGKGKENSFTLYGQLLIIAIISLLAAVIPFAFTVLKNSHDSFRGGAIIFPSQGAVFFILGATTFYLARYISRRLRKKNKK